MSFFISRAFAELQSLKKWKWSYLLNWMEYRDEILHTHWYWQDVTLEIVKWHLGLVEVLPRLKFWKSATIAKWHLSSFEALPIAKFWKKWKWPCLLNWVEYCDEVVHIHWYWHDVVHEVVKWHLRFRNDIFHRSRLCRAPNSEKVNMAISLELSEILWWSFAYTLILTWCSPWDSQMTFGIGRGFLEVQILKKVKFNSNRLEYFNKILQTHWYWSDLAQGIAKWHLSSVEALPSAKFWKSENGPLELCEIIW